MTRLLAILPFVCIGVAWAAPEEPVAIKKGVSPDKRFEVVLEADKDTSSFSRYEMKEDSWPRFLLREVATGRAVGKVKYPSDPSSDERVLRDKTELFWRADGRAVAINTSERYYSHTTILAHDPKKEEFVAVPFPDYKSLTGCEPPNSEDLRPRGHASAIEWTPDGLLVCTFQASPLPSYQGRDSLHHRATLRVSAQGMKVISCEALKRAD